jgi:alpha-glucosidase (family GH31 glycosyl hydrolase)
MTNPAARQWWWDRHPPFLGDRVAGLWTDLGEPERHPSDMMHFLGPAEKVHNIYNLLWARTVFEGMGRFRPGERVFNLTRSGFAGIQRYGAIPWSGDVSRSFGGLAVQLPMLLNMGMSGLAYQNSDIGGYARNPTTPELYIRWMEFGIFTPVTRAHGAGETVNGSPTEPWMFGPEAEEICRTMLGLRYRLMPYNYTMAHRNYESGLPLARPLTMMYNGAHEFVGESSTYLWGDSFLVSPVVKAGETTKTVIFPPGEWIDFWTDEVLRTDEVVHRNFTREVAAPLGRIPLFVKSGSIIPMAPLMRYSDERPLDTLVLALYPGHSAADSAFLYEDDGKTTAYQSGAFSMTKFVLRSADNDGAVSLSLGVGRATGVYAGKPPSRFYEAEIHSFGGRPASVRRDGNDLREFPPDSGADWPGTGYRYDRALSRLEIRFRCDADSACNLSVMYPHMEER